MFETQFKDAMGRVGRLYVRGRTVETPLIFPVINPNIDLITPGELQGMGFEGVITNSYIIYRNEPLRGKALKSGVSGLLGFDGVVMTDSGSYQLYQYGSVEVSPEEIVRFQENIKSDIGIILDIPTPPDAGHARAKADLEETIRRAKAAAHLKRDMLLGGTVQGSTHLDLREESAKAMADLDFDIYPIGGVVPLMESYRFSDLARIIIHVKRHLPPHKPVHLFGAGHPMMLALAVALGCDLFDSAAYSLYAREGRYLTTTGTLKLSEMRTLPCQCQVCSEHTIDELRASPEKTRLLALHNLHVTKEEIDTIKEAVHDGSLWELVEMRCRAHPNLLEALRILRDYPLEDYEPLTKPSAFFYTGPESLHRPEVKRHRERLKRITTSAKTLVLLSKQDGDSPGRTGSNREYHLCYLSPVFGIIPTEIEEVYPLAQHLYPRILDEPQRSMMKRAVKEYSKGFSRVLIDRALQDWGIEGEVLENLEIEADTEVKMKALADYQFGAGAGEVLFKGCRGRYARTGRLRHIFDGETLVATVRASDGIIVPALEGARRLLRLPWPRNRVVVEDEEVCRFVREGKSLFAKFITDCDPEIVPGSEVLVVDREDRLVNWGRAALDARELIAFKRGVGVKTRGSMANDESPVSS
ncbi:MAG: tRNA guanosine(15) transglycosylase TgtA [Methanobacteriota archaeon]|nr:MAG: tRNA guanosine(15) transglycosylase TgtA [Euryarchaeota archaeon]